MALKVRGPAFPFPGVAASSPSAAGAAEAFDLDDREAVRRQRDRQLLDAERLQAGEAGEHQLLVGVLVVDHQQRPATVAAQRQHADEVGVVAELRGLPLHTLLGDVELGRAGQDRVAPAHDDGRVVAVRDDQVVELVRRDGLERQRARLALLEGVEQSLGDRRGGGGGCGRRRAGRGGSRATEAEHERAHGTGAHHSAARHPGVHDVAEVRVVRPVRHRVVAGVAAAVEARHRVAPGVAEQRQQAGSFSHRGRAPRRQYGPRHGRGRLTLRAAIGVGPDVL